MNPYLVDTRYATEGLIALLTREEHRLAEAQQSAKLFKDEAQKHFEAMKRSGFSPEGVIDLFGYEEAAERFQADEAAILQSLAILPAALNAISGALLQISKQGISVVYGGLGACPPGRLVAGVALKDVIWQARNQSMHFEDGVFSGAVQTCFAQLAFNAGAAFTLGPVNLAHNVVQLLGWSNQANYEKDLMSLLP